MILVFICINIINVTRYNIITLSSIIKMIIFLNPIVIKVVNDIYIYIYKIYKMKKKKNLTKDSNVVSSDPKILSSAQGGRA